MQLQMGSDEENTDVSNDLKDIKITTPANTSETSGTKNNNTNSEVSK